MFPQYKIKKFLGITISKKEDGWKDLGKVNGTYVSKNVYEYYSHVFCDTISHVGKENGKIFRFCPKCMIKVTEDKNYN